ncbi:MAG: arsenate reductase ArsC [Firmicutes bacterium]|nr:arsenate reductase ArsC [Bacillota bacterium]
MKMLFLCTANACRSQMAEGFAKRLAQGQLWKGAPLTDVPEPCRLWEPRSAGIEPTQLDPRAVAVMREIGIDISDQYSKGLDLGELFQMDLVITLCGDAEERCPRTPPEVRHLHWPLPDPAKATGTPEEVLEKFRSVRDEIGRRVVRWALEGSEEDSHS